MAAAPFRFCPYCGQPLEERTIYQQVRPTCPACGFVHFRDPKVAVIARVVWRDAVLLIRRGVDSMKGMWALPGGYMDAGEMPAQALARELREEVGLSVEGAELLEIFPMVGTGGATQGIVLAFGAQARAGEGLAHPPHLLCADDASEAGWFTRGELPRELAFDSTKLLLARWRAA